MPPDLLGQLASAVARAFRVVQQRLAGQALAVLPLQDSPDDEAAMIMGHEMAHALREHARARIAKTQGTGTLLSLGASLFGLGDLGGVAANIGTQLISLRFSRDDETDADLVGLELAARGGYNPQAAVSLWEKMGQAGGGSNGPSFLSTHPSGPARIQQLQANVPKVQGLYQRARS